MIKYSGMAVSFLQCLPKKPIKYGIKTFLACCGYTGYPLSGEVYLGKDSATDENSVLYMVKRLITDVNLTIA